MIELNCDVGEGRTDDHLFMPYIQRCNIACGAHAGDPNVTRTTIDSALQYQVIIGAHPSYPDKENFGRNSMLLSRQALHETIATQLEYVSNITEQAGGVLQHIKAHGALYNDLAKDAGLAEAFCQVVKQLAPSLSLIGLADSKLTQAAQAQDIDFIAEAFCDRRYANNLSLISRQQPNALITSPIDAVQQLNQIVREQLVTTASGELVRLKADTICIHSDTPNALAIAQAAFEAQKIW